MKFEMFTEDQLVKLGDFNIKLAEFIFYASALYLLFTYEGSQAYTTFSFILFLFGGWLFARFILGISGLMLDLTSERIFSFIPDSISLNPKLILIPFSIMSILIKSIVGYYCASVIFKWCITQ